MTKKKSLWIRNYHRDIGYFYVGLIIAFSISGIALNHRTDWDPQEYTFLEKQFKVRPLKTDLNETNMNQLTDEVAKQVGATLKFRGFRKEEGIVEIYLDGGFAEVSPLTGQGKVELFHTRPVIGQMTWLHKTTNSVWIWYSDIFGIGMLFIAITGMFITSGKNGFKKRGYLFALGGLLFPIIALIAFM